MTLTVKKNNMKIKLNQARPYLIKLKLVWRLSNPCDDHHIAHIPTFYGNARHVRPLVFG